MLRLALVVVLTAVLAFFMPLIVALLFAIIVQLPLAWLLFSGPRRRVNDAMAQVVGAAPSERARLQSALSGDARPELTRPGRYADPCAGAGRYAGVPSGRCRYGLLAGSDPVGAPTWTVPTRRTGPGWRMRCG